MNENRTFKLVLIALLGGVAVAVVIAFETVDRPSPIAPSAPVNTAIGDPLAVELARCQGLGPDDPVDARCDAAWAESNRRFFGRDKPGEAR